MAKQFIDGMKRFLLIRIGIGLGIILCYYVSKGVLAIIPYCM